MGEYIIMDILRKLMNVYWLRPETALWRAVDMETMKNFDFKGKSLDLGCGDGVFSFIRAGGNFDDSFDDYQSLGNLEKFFDNNDIHDSFKEGYKPKISRKPDYFISFALDHKKTLLYKAKELDFYNNFVLHDANKKLPFEDNSFYSIFSNIVYWIDNPQKTFNEIARVLQTGGAAALMLPDKIFPEFSFYNRLFVKKNNDKNFQFLKYLDRGRFDLIKVCKDYKEWEEIIKNSGLSIAEHKMHLSKTIIEMWDIGLRPIFPVLLKLIRSIKNENILTEVKREWIEIFMKFLQPIFELEKESSLNQNTEKAFHYFVLKK